MLQFVLLIAAFFSTMLLMPPVLCAESNYLVVKGGAFLPNGEGTATQGGLNDFNTGYDVSIGVGYHPAPYAAVEASVGVYAVERTNSSLSASSRQEDTTKVQGVPVTLLLKGVLNADPFELAIGAGGAYVYASVENTVRNISETAHGSALGYVVTGSADYSINERVGIGAEIRWFSAKPTIDLPLTEGTSTRWDVGGTTLSVTGKYRF